MNGPEIREQINFTYKQLEQEQEASVGTFVLNKRIAQLRQCVSNLQAQCEHKFENGKCIYCDKEAPKE